jgi:methylenetetrahydrofolate dehydrogenase(NAD+)/5,10-methenyltetrahydrofolate cyclohydrolase
MTIIFFAALFLSADGCKGGLDLTTTICHRYTEGGHLAESVSAADIVVTATGVPGLIR